MTSAPALAAPGPDGRSWTHLLLGAVRAGFRADVYVPDPEDRGVVFAGADGRAA
jgi:hypothetical protein